MEKRLEEVLFQEGWQKLPSWECLYFHQQTQLLLSVYVDDMITAGRKTSLAPMWLRLKKTTYLADPTPLIDHVFLGCTQREP